MILCFICIIFILYFIVHMCECHMYLTYLPTSVSARTSTRILAAFTPTYVKHLHIARCVVRCLNVDASVRLSVCPSVTRRPLYRIGCRILTPKILIKFQSDCRADSGSHLVTRDPSDHQWTDQWPTWPMTYELRLLSVAPTWTSFVLLDGWCIFMLLFVYIVYSVYDLQNK